MKKISYLAAASIALLGLASCSNEEIPAPVQGDGNVSFTLQLPAELGTRAFGDGEKAKDLYFAVYEAESKTPVIVSNAEYQFTGLQTTVNLKLANGRSYDIIWWAQSPDVDCYTFKADEQTVEINYTGVLTNDENRDAFFQHTSIANVQTSFNQTVRLYRPFAQVNVGTNDLNEPAVRTAYGENLENLKTSMKTKAYKTLNLLTNEVSDEVDVTFEPNVIPSAETFPVAGYDYLSMDYLLVPAEKTLIDITYSILGGGADDIDMTNIPVQRNYQTNIFGQLLTSNGQFNVIIMPAFAGRYDVPWPVSSVDDFKAALNQPNPYIVLTEDIDLSAEGRVTLPDNTQIELGGNKLVIDRLTTTAGADVKFSNGEVQQTSTSAGIRFGGAKGKIEAENVTFNMTSNWAFTFDRNTPTDNYDDNTLTLKNCTVNTGALGIYVAAGVGSEIIKGNKVILENTTINSTETPLVVLQSVDITATGCTFNGTWQAALFRSGSLDATDCEFNLDCAASYPVSNAANYLKANNDYTQGNWGAANQAAIAGVVMGSAGVNGYNNVPVTGKFNGCTVNLLGSADQVKPYAAIYMVNSPNQTVDITFEGGSYNAGRGLVYRLQNPETGWLKFNGENLTGTNGSWN